MSGKTQKIIVQCSFEQYSHFTDEESDSQPGMTADLSEHRLWWKTLLYVRPPTLGMFVLVSRPEWESLEGPEQMLGLGYLLPLALWLSLTIAQT